MYLSEHNCRAGRIRAAVLSLFILILFTALFPSRPHAATIRFRASLGRTRYLAGEQGTVRFQNTKRITYRFKSSNKKVFTVNKAGIITAKKKGKATLTVTGVWKKGSKQKKWTKTVTIRVYSCKLSKKNLSVVQSKSAALKIKGDTLKRKVSWYSETPECCTVSANGRVYGQRAGIGYVCARVGKYVTLRCRVTVTVTPLPGASISLLVNPTHTYGAIDLAAIDLIYIGQIGICFVCVHSGITKENVGVSVCTDLRYSLGKRIDGAGIAVRSPSGKSAAVKISVVADKLSKLHSIISCNCCIG